MDLGNNNRTVGATAMNQQSSRSHSIFTITIETCGPGPTGEPQVNKTFIHIHFSRIRQSSHSSIKQKSNTLQILLNYF
jgi:hypothetical protein